MRKSDIINKAAAETGLPASEVDAVLCSVLDGITGALARGEDVQLVGFGKFTAGERAPRTYRRPGTGEQVEAKRKRTARFTAGSGLKKALNPGDGNEDR